MKCNTSGTSLRLIAILQALSQDNLPYLASVITPYNVNYKDPVHHMSLLMWAVTLGRLPITQLLLSHGASIFDEDAQGFSTLHRAVWSGKIDIVRTLLFLSPLSRFRAVHNDQSRLATTETAERESEFDVTHTKRINAREKNGSDTQQCNSEMQGCQASSSEHESSTSTLRPCKSEPYRSDALTWRANAIRLVNMPHRTNGRTPLMLAAINNSMDIAQFLIQYCGADIHAQDAHGHSAADHAAMRGDRDLVNMFLTNMPDGSCNTHCDNMQQWAERCSELASTVSQRENFRRINKDITQHSMQHSKVSFA